MSPWAMIFCKATISLRLQTNFRTYGAQMVGDLLPDVKQICDLLQVPVAYRISEDFQISAFKSWKIFFRFSSRTLNLFKSRN